MPSHVAPTPMAAATTMAVPVRLVRRSAVAAGPMSSAVDKMAPMVMAESDTASARATRKPTPTSRTRHAPGGGQIGAQ